MNESPKFFPSIIEGCRNLIDFAYWEEIKQLYEAEKYRESTLGVIKYANPVLFEKYGNADKSEFSMPHGSVIVNLKVSDQHFSVKAPFLKIPAQNPIPLYRQVSQLNFSPLNLASINLNGEQLAFEYECPIDACDPYKVWDILSDICSYADNYDDKFIDDFNAERISEPIIEKHSPEKLAELYTNAMKMVEMAFQQIEYLESKQYNGYLWDVVIITLFQIDNYCLPQGNLRTELEKAIQFQMQPKQNQAHIAESVANGKAFLKKLQTWGEYKFKKDLYLIENFVPTKQNANDVTIKEASKNIYERAQVEFSKKDYLGCTFSVQYMFYYLFYYYHLDDKYTRLINNSLENAGGKPWSESAEILLNAMDGMMNDDFSQADAAPKQKKGFFSSLFSN